MSTVHDSTDDFVEYLRKTDKDDLEVKNLMQLCTCEILARIGCGVKPDIMKDPENSVFYKQVMNILLPHIYFKQIFQPMQFYADLIRIYTISKFILSCCSEATLGI